MAIYIILGLAFLAIGFLLVKKTESSDAADAAEAQVKDITTTIQKSNDIEQKNSALSDANLDERLRDFTD